MSFSKRGQAPVGGLPPVALIAGPTASGKSDLAVRLAQRLGQEGTEAVIVNADSAQVYADLQVLSARPSAADMGGIEHRLFGAWDGAAPCSAADWAAAARREIAAIHARGAVPILVGGTGLYIRTLLEGIAPVPPIPTDVRAEVRSLPVAEAHAQLALLDPQRAATLHPSDTTRVARALEVIRATGKPLSHWQMQKEGGIAEAIDLRAAILLPPRPWLYERCDMRFAAMLEGGAIEEVRTLLTRKLPETLPIMRAIGVPEIARYLSGEWSLDEAKTRGAQATRQYVKRQFTWLRHQPPPSWHRLESHPYDEVILNDVLFHNLKLT